MQGATARLDVIMYAFEGAYEATYGVPCPSGLLFQKIDYLKRNVLNWLDTEMKRSGLVCSLKQIAYDLKNDAIIVDTVEDGYVLSIKLLSVSNITAEQLYHQWLGFIGG